jgi:cysteine synthase
VTETTGSNRQQPAATDRSWVQWAIALLRAGEDYVTPLVRLDGAHRRRRRILMKDESRQPSGSLKHRLARALLVDAICAGAIGPRTTLVEASSGSTAISLAHFAKLLRLDFIAVVPVDTTDGKLTLIRAAGGKLHLVPDLASAPVAAAALALEHGWHFVGQFDNAAHVSDWRGPHCLGAQILSQCIEQSGRPPAWIVLSVGTGGTLNAIGRHLRYCGSDTRICLADPTASSFHATWANSAPIQKAGSLSLVEGIGGPVSRPGFVPTLVDDAIVVPDAASFAAARVLPRYTGRRHGCSSGTHLWASMQLLGRMEARNEPGDVVTILCDDGERYADTLFNDSWLAERGLDSAHYEEAFETFLRTGYVPPFGSLASGL